MRDELHQDGLEIVTVALDSTGEAARNVLEPLAPTHPALIDETHTVDKLFGVVNVPSGIWIDEDGGIVRPPEPAFPGRSPYQDAQISDSLPQRIKDMLLEAKKIQAEPEKYVAALRDWVGRGRDSRYVLSSHEVIERSRPRPVEESFAAAHFELGQHLHRAGKTADGVRHWREAHRLQPDNWTYKRQAWSLADPTQGPTDVYDGDWLSDVRKIGAENYYPPLQM